MFAVRDYLISPSGGYGEFLSAYEAYVRGLERHKLFVAEHKYSRDVMQFSVVLWQNIHDLSIKYGVSKSVVFHWLIFLNWKPREGNVRLMLVAHNLGWTLNKCRWWFGHFFRAGWCTKIYKSRTNELIRTQCFYHVTDLGLSVRSDFLKAFR